MPAKPPGKVSSELQTAKPCPICGKPSTQQSRPFCSDRCRDVDLNRWLSGSYAIPARPDEDDDNE
jgi:uncharacterized protein